MDAIKETMKVELYRLFAVQSFGRRIPDIDGRVAVYVKHHEYPNTTILLDARELAKKLVDRRQLIENKPELYMSGDPSVGWSPMTDPNRLRLKFFERVFSRGMEFIEKYPDTKYAIFVDNTYINHWHGERTLYKLKSFDEVKTGNGDKYSGCVPFKTIKL